MFFLREKNLYPRVLAAFPYITGTMPPRVFSLCERAHMYTRVLRSVELLKLMLLRDLWL